MVSKDNIFNIEGKVAAVTGGGSGLGRDFCEILAEYGADIVCMDVRMERATEACAYLEKQYGHKAVPLELDVSQYDQVKVAFKKVADDFGKLDILVNNAGVMSPPRPIHEIDIDHWHKLFGVNLHGTFYCMKEALGIMIKQQKGSIINLSSVSGVFALDPNVQCTGHYITSKAGVIGLTRQGAAEYGQ